MENGRQLKIQSELGREREKEEMKRESNRECRGQSERDGK